VANPVRFGDQHWVAYPFIDSRIYSARPDEIEVAGTALGRIHAAGTSPHVPQPVLGRLLAATSAFPADVCCRRCVRASFQP
jgi:hypothetical protein